MPPPPSSDQDAPGGFRIAGVASRSASTASSVAPSPATHATRESRPPIKLDRDRHAVHRLPAKPIDTATTARAGEAQSRPWPQRPNPPHHRSSSSTAAAASSSYTDDEEEEGAIDDSSVSSRAQPRSPSATGFRPAPPKTPPPLPSGSSNNARRTSHGHGADRDRHSNSRRDDWRSYEPVSPPKPNAPATSSYAPGSHLRSPSPPASAPRSGREHGNGAYPSSDQRHQRQPSDRREQDAYLTGGNGTSSRNQYRRGPDDRYPEAGMREPVRGKDGAADSARDWWGSDRRSDWERERDRGSDRRPDRAERDAPWDHHARHNHHRGEQRDRQHERNGRERELSPPAAGRDAQQQQHRFAGWSPTSNGHGESFAPRPPSRMGRTEPAPLLSRDHVAAPAGQRDAAESTLKRPRSPGGRRSPPAGLLKRKANFNAVVPPTLTPSEKEGLAAEDNVAPGAPIPHKTNTLESPVMPSSAAGAALPGSHPGSALPTASSSAATVAATPAALPADANLTTTCDALDDPACPSVRLSCLPRKHPLAPSLSGRERRKARAPPVPLNQRKFVGCSSLDDYEISIKLGQGTFGEVLKGRQILTGTQVALKKVTIHDAKDGLPITALREIKLLKKLRHPSIVPVIDMAFRPSGERGKLGDVYMVEPYMDHDLNGMLENPSIRLEHSQIKLYMKQLLEGTLYLHKNRILHRDMKAANLLINNQGQLQIADFGLARPYRDPGQSWTGKGWTGGTHRYTNMVVTRWYRPPELLAGEKRYGPPIDMWGIGCILAEMVMGKPLFKGTSELNQLELIAKLCGSPNETNFPGWSSLPGVKDADPTGRPDPHPEIPGQHEFGTYPRRVKEQFRNVYDAGPGCADLIDKLLVLDPRKRLTAQQALEHEWFWTKPYPADPASLPKYEHSKEIDRARREWKPAPAPVPAPAPGQVGAPAALPPQLGAGGGGGGMGGMGAGMMGAAPRPHQHGMYMQGPQHQQHPHPHQHQQHQHQQQRPYARGGYPGPQSSTLPLNNGPPIGMPPDSWDNPPLNYGAPPPRYGPGGGGGGGGGRHAYPGHQQHPQHPPQGQGRFPHPNARPPPPHQGLPKVPHNTLPPRPGDSWAGGAPGGGGPPQNPYSM